MHLPLRIVKERSLHVRTFITMEDKVRISSVNADHSWSSPEHWASPSSLVEAHQNPLVVAVHCLVWMQPGWIYFWLNLFKNLLNATCLKIFLTLKLIPTFARKGPSSRHWKTTSLPGISNVLIFLIKFDTSADHVFSGGNVFFLPKLDRFYSDYRCE